ncbi:DUF7260 family protein [Haloferax sulfurifontis]|uniref:DUF7260 domain-containing protein n=1 Tax=Haloferax sulfurifontis ATCC BAA-897 TaxID=662480 RepID=M0I8G4_9EURY|nr:hypothetical protein [Haloferax sulfurifontis]ELZ93100.1 hypothetical protein C441_09441 [Haloferax sulfurifontis ATCC BAA-897]
MIGDEAADVRDALGRVEGEREQVLAKRRAVERFERRVRKLAAQSARATACGTASMPAATRRDAAGGGRRRVRELFAETIRAHSVADGDESEPLSVTIREEFGPEVAAALDSDTGGRFTPAVKEAVVSAAVDRKRGLDGMRRALDGEERSLRAALAVLDECEDWLVRADETPLSGLGFDALRRRHEALADRREACDRLVRERQRRLGGATHHTAAVEVDHRLLAAYLYEDRATDYPVLAAATRVDGVCADCQRAVRDHLVRRV